MRFASFVCTLLQHAIETVTVFFLLVSYSILLRVRQQTCCNPCSMCANIAQCYVLCSIGRADSFFFLFSSVLFRQISGKMHSTRDNNQRMRERERGKGERKTAKMTREKEKQIEKRGKESDRASAVHSFDNANHNK